MEEKRRDAGNLTAAIYESPPSEPSSSRRRGGALKRKASGGGFSNSSSTPSKRVTREKSSHSHPPIHNGPLTRARQGPSNLASASAVGGTATSAAAAKRAEQARLSLTSAGDALTALTEELNKESELQALEAEIETEFEAIRSRGANAHVVPNHCGWFSWTNIHFIEESTLPSFFNGKSETRTADTYLDIRNWIMKKFHANPSTQIELKDLAELEIGDSDAKQEVMEFLDHWGLINFHPFPPTGSEVVAPDDDGAAEKNSLVDKLYHFETPQSSMAVAPKTNIATPAVPSGLFPESAVAEELVRPEGPSVEYHCNSCSADCSRKRYHCQKQADFDLCTDCFSNGKFDSGMSSSDFILMEPAEVPGISGGKWTDQETLLLLEALELYKENWNEIAEHVATKTKAQCILHFVQMPIEDTFFDCDDDMDASSKEIQDLDSVDKDSLIPKDASETTEGKAGAIENQSPTSPMETAKEDMTEVKIGQDTSKPEDTNEVIVGQDTSKMEDTTEVKVGHETGENCALKALKEAFEAVGYSSTPEGPLSFAEAGNPVMALAIFLGHLIGPELGTASAHNSLKSISGNSPGIKLATRHCFLLEDPPKDSKDPAVDSVVAEVANKENQKEETQDEKNPKEDLLDDNRNKKNEDSSPRGKTSSGSLNGGSIENLNASKEQDVIVASEEERHANLSKSSNSEVPEDRPTSTMRESDDLKSEAELPPSSAKESGEGTSAGEHSEPTEASKDVDISDSLPSEKKLGASNLMTEPSNSTEAPKDVDVVPNSLPPENNDPQHQATSNPVGEPHQPSEALKDVDMVSNAQHSEKEPPQPVPSNATVKNEASEDQTKDGNKEKQDCRETKEVRKIDKIKRAAVSALSAAAVKAKLLANQEEDYIRQLSTLLIDKQLHKLETKLAFFNEMENVVMRVREQLDRSRQRLYHERAQIIAARLGIPPSSSRGMPPSMPTNRIPMNIANSFPRPPMSMTSQRPPMSRPMGTAVPNPSMPFPSTTMSGSRAS